MEYSDLKRVNYVVVPSNYSLNSHTDARSVRGNFTETSPAVSPRLDCAKR